MTVYDPQQNLNRRSRRGFWARTPTSAQLIFLTSASLVITSAAALLVVGGVVNEAMGSVTHEAQYLNVRLTLTLGFSAILGIGMIMSAIRWMLLRPLNHLRHGMAKVTSGELESIGSSPMPSREWHDLHDTFEQMVLQLRQARAAHERSQKVLAEYHGKLSGKGTFSIYKNPLMQGLAFCTVEFF